MPDFLFSVGAAYSVGEKPKVTIAFPPGSSFAALPIEVAMVLVNEVNAQILRLVNPPAANPPGPPLAKANGAAEPTEEKAPP